MDFDFFGPQQAHHGQGHWKVYPDPENPEYDIHEFDPHGLGQDDHIDAYDKRFKNFPGAQVHRKSGDKMNSPHGGLLYMFRVLRAQPTS